jgi:hypothetical protein
MSLRYRYKLVRVGRPVLPLGGRFVRPRPLVPVTVVGAAGSKTLDAILDTAADDTVFAETVAAAIGLDLTAAPVGSGAGVGMAHVSVRYAEVTFRLATQQERREWKAWAGFTAAKLAYPLLGFAGFLQFFNVDFRGGLEEVELTVNNLYPGT